jgi:phosphoenolpyruvate---glycerone phosphotransferase subunit DhaL
MKAITQPQIIQWLINIAQIMKDNKEYLTELDSAIGDADHGFNMERGFNKVLEKINDGSINGDIGSVLKNTGMALISSVGGAAGPLYGTFFMQMGTVLVSKDTLSLTDLTNSIESGVQGIKNRGRASVGEKTMIDVLEPVVESLKKSIATENTIESALIMVVEVAEKGMKSTIDLIGQKGRSSYLGVRSIGHQDAGATSSYLILKTLKDVLTNSKI